MILRIISPILSILHQLVIHFRTDALLGVLAPLNTALQIIVGHEAAAVTGDAHIRGEQLDHRAAHRAGLFRDRRHLQPGRPRTAAVNLRHENRLPLDLSRIFYYNCGEKYVGFPTTVAAMDAYFDILQKYFKNFERIATLPKSDDTQYLGSYQINKPALIMFGSESSGLSENLKSFAVQNITIEMKKDVESLNLAISAGIILYKLFVK